MELFKLSGNMIIKQMEQSINKIQKEEKVPEAGTLSIIYPIHKKGDIINCKNYKGLSILDTLCRVLSYLLLKLLFLINYMARKN